MVADELRRQADEFIDLVGLSSKIGRDPNERQERAQKFHPERRPANAVTAGYDEDVLDD